MTLDRYIARALETAGVWVVPITKARALCLPEYGWLFVGPLTDRQRSLHYKANLRGVRTAVVESTHEALLTVSNWQLESGNQLARLRGEVRAKHLRLVK